MKLKHTDDIKAVFTVFHMNLKICCLWFLRFPLMLVIRLTT